MQQLTIKKLLWSLIQEKISAEVSDGVLKIEIPKIAKEEKKDDVKHIEVK